MQELGATIFSGLVLGSTYAIMAMGLTLVWGGLRILILTQGSLYMLGAYTALVVGNLGLPPVAGLVCGFLIIGLLGVLIYVGPLRILAARPDQEMATILATFSLAIVLENAALLQFGPRTRAVQGLVGGRVDVGGVVLTWNGIMIITIAAVILVAMGTALKWTRLGLTIRALAQQREGAQLAGISLHRTSSLVLFVSSGLAGVGGVLLGSFYFVSPTVGGTFLLIALIVTILGGLGSIIGTLYAAYLVGITQAVVSLYVGIGWSLPILFAVIILVLILRPGGIAGKVSYERL